MSFTGFLRRRPDVRKMTLWAIGLIVAVADVVAFVESYQGLYLWADHHGLHGGWARAWPLQVDAFIVLGELVLVLAYVDGWGRKPKIVAGCVTVGGMIVSVWANVGHVLIRNDGHLLSVQITAGVPPVAATLGLFIGVWVMKQTRTDLVKTTDLIGIPMPRGTEVAVVEKPVDDVPRQFGKGYRR